LSTNSLFRQRGFTFLWWGQLLSITGDRLTYLALMGLMLEHSARDGGASFAALLAVFGNVVVAPVLLLAPFAGALIDRLNLKHVVVGADLLRAINVIAIPTAYALSPNIFVTFVLVFSLFTLNVLFLPAKSALIPAIVPPAELLRANSFLAGAGVAATGLGAVAGGYIVDRFGWPVAMQIDAATYLISVATLAAIPHVPRNRRAGPAATPHYLRDVWEGWGALRANAGVTTCIIALAAVWWAGGVLHVAGNQHVLESGQNPGMLQIGVLLCVIGLGTGLGTWWINTHGRAWTINANLGGGLVLAGCAIAVFGSASQLVWFLVAGLLLGLFAAPALILTETGLQQYAPPGQRARVFSGKDFLMRLTLLTSVSMTAWIVGYLGTSATLMICAATVAIVGLAVLRRPILTDHRDRSEPAANQQFAHESDI
jgi:MFS family permease